MRPACPANPKWAWATSLPTLADIAERTQCGLVVIGARGQGAIASALLGSVSQALVHASPVPVTIVKHPDTTVVTQPADLPGDGGEPGPV